MRQPLVQPLSQQIGKQAVIAVPAPLVVQGGDEQVGAFQVFQGCLPGSGGIAQQGVTERAAQAVQDRRAQQKGLDAFGLLVQNLLNSAAIIPCPRSAATPCNAATR